MQKNLIVLLIFSFSLLSAYSQELKIQASVDERVELMSIVARLAGYDEYKYTSVHNYGKEIDSYFQSYENDSLIAYAKKIRKKSSVAYDAVMSMAVHIQIKDGDIGWKNNISATSLQDKRWNKHGDEFVRLLSKFYKTSHFDTFFHDHIPMYKECLMQYDSLFESIDDKWFERYFGKNVSNNFHFIVGFAFNGGGYGPHVINKNGTYELYSIIGVSVDNLGRPVADSWDFEATIHEYCHTFCNPIIDENYLVIKESLTPYFDIVKNNLLASDYTDLKSTAYEYLVRASTILYLKEHNMSDTEISKHILQEQANGFILMPDLVMSLEEYEKSRSIYPTLNEYMSKINEVFRLGNPKLMYDNILQEFPKITSFSIENKSKNIDPDLQELIITFNKPMNEWINGWITKSGLFHKANNRPEMISYTWDKETHKTLSIHIKLAQQANYKIYFAKNQMISTSGLILDKEYVLEFKTR